MKNNIILQTDSYKVSHYKAYAPNVKKVYSYLESRGGEYDKIVFFGLQYYLMQYLQGVVVTEETITEAKEIINPHLGDKIFYEWGWRHIIEKHGGKLPIEIKAIPEGTVTNPHNVLMTICNTDDKCYWLTNYIETLLMKVWYPITIASQSFYLRNKVLDYLNVGGTPESIEYKVHDFGYRGVATEEQAWIGGGAHLLSFRGTDTIAGLRFLKEYYKAPNAGESISATEHSIINSFGNKENEIDAFRNFLEQFPTGIIACVSDTYDIYNACENLWGTELKDQIINRDGVLVIRPDSGDFMEIIPKLLQILWDKFGGSKNEKGFKVLDPHVRLIQGDGMDPKTIVDLYRHITVLGWSADNLTVGSGGGLLQKVNRDTLKMAIKCSAIQTNKGWLGVAKNPTTDSGKKSKKGFQKLIRGNFGFETVSMDPNQTFSSKDFEDNILKTVFENGEILLKTTYEEVKARMRE